LVSSYFITFPEYERPINALVGMMLWLKFLYFLRIFRETGHFITMILAVLSDMKVFMSVYFVVIIAFANAFYILSNNNEADSLIHSFNSREHAFLLQSFPWSL